MARVCQLTDDLKYYLCMEPVDMRGKMYEYLNFKKYDMIDGNFTISSSPIPKT